MENNTNLEKTIICSIFDSKVRLNVISYLEKYMFKDELYSSLFQYFKSLETEKVDDYNTLKLKISTYFNIENSDNEYRLRTIYEEFNDYITSDLKETLNQIENFIVNKKLYNYINKNLAENKGKLVISDSIKSQIMESVDFKISVEKTTYDFTNEEDLQLMGMNDTEEISVIKSKFPIINECSNNDGYCKGDLVCFAARPGTGKAQPLSAKIKTPTGWTTMGQIKVGDIIDNAVGGVTTVIGVYPQGVKDIYRITFEDGRSTECCKEHLWDVVYRNSTKTRETGDIIKLLESKTYKDRLYINLYKSNLQEKSISLPLSPYLLGSLLGDGGLVNPGIRMSSIDSHILDKLNLLLKEYNCELNKISGDNVDYGISQIKNILKSNLNPVKKILSDLDLTGKYSYEKVIPEIYINSSYSQRVELLQGLFDTDGFVDKNSNVQFCTTSEVLSRQVQYLVRSIGGLCKIKTKIPYFTHNGVKKQGRLAYILNIRHATPSLFFSLPRKLERCNDSHQYSKYLKLRIKSVELVKKEEAQCIMVDSDEHLYVTDDFIVTHNTIILIDEASSFIKQGFKVLYVTLGDMKAKSMLVRFLSNLTGEKSYDVRKNWFSYFIKCKEYLSNLRSIVLEAGEYDVRTVIAKANKIYNSGFEFDVVIFDYDQNFKVSDGFSTDMYNAFGAIYQKLKAFASTKYLVMTASQIKIGEYEEEIVGMNALADSSKKANQLDYMIGIGRNNKNPSVGSLHLGKVRDGRSNVTVPIKFNNEYSSIDQISKEEYDYAKKEVLSDEMNELFGGK